MYSQTDNEEIKKGLRSIARGSARLLNIPLSETNKQTIEHYIALALQNLESAEDLSINESEEDDQRLLEAALNLLIGISWVAQYTTADAITKAQVEGIVHRRMTQLNETQRDNLKGMWPYKARRQDNW